MKELEAIFILRSFCEEAERIIEKHKSPTDSIQVPDNICFEVEVSGVYLWNGKRRLGYDKIRGGWDCEIFLGQPETTKMKLIPIDPHELEPGDWFVYYPERSDLNKVDSYFLCLGEKKSVRFNTTHEVYPIAYDSWTLDDDNFHKVVPVL